MLEALVPLLAAAVLCVSLSRRLGFGSVLGYLLAGVAIGPYGLKLIEDTEEIATVSELGVVMLLFLIGLELRPARLWVMRKAVFGLGIGQLVVTGSLFAALAHFAGSGWAGSTVLGLGLALSSTAIVLPMLGERNLLASPAGRDSFAVLLFQDLAFIPLVALVPLLAGDAMPIVPWRSVAIAIAAVATILLVGRFLIPQVFKLIGGARTPEVFTATALLIVVGTAALAHEAGLSMSLGAFLAGVLLSSSEYRHELQADIEPFEGLLLGFFFMSVGMSAELSLIAAEPRIILFGVLLLLTGKTAIAYLLALVAGRSRTEALRFALALPQGSEFSFVLFGSAVAVGALTERAAGLATLVIALSMAATPILFFLSERFLVPRLAVHKEPTYDEIPQTEPPVIICGFGRVGQIVGRILRMQGIPFTALDKNATQIEGLRRFGFKVYYGDPGRAELLRAAGAETAKLVVVALDDMEETLAVVDMIRRNFPKLQIYARARNRRHAHLLMDRNVDGLVRETFHSSLRLSEMVLTATGIDPVDALRAVEVFRVRDQQAMIDTHAFYEDESRLIQSAQDVSAELAAIFERDRPVKE